MGGNVSCNAIESSNCKTCNKITNSETTIEKETIA